MNEVIVDRQIDVKSLILTVRGVQVLLDSDVAMLYGYETKYINLAATRNKVRFPENFRFQLTHDEASAIASLRHPNGVSNHSEENGQFLRLQNATSKKETRGGRRYCPYVYTEQGIAMLSGMLKNDIAIQVSIGIMQAFVEMRRFISTHGTTFAYASIVEYRLNEQYPYLQVMKSDEFHDRFIIVDNKKLYHIGASLKDAGKKCFAISVMNNMNFIKSINSYILLTAPSPDRPGTAR